MSWISSLALKTRIVLSVLILMTASFVISFVVQHHGIGLMGDTSHLFHYGSQAGLSSLSVHDAPLYPLVLRLHGLFGLTIRSFAGILDAVLLAAFSALLFVFFHALNRTCWISLVCATTVLFSRPILSAFSYAQTEALFLPLVLAHMFFFLVAPDRNTRLMIACAGAACFFAVAARYAAAFLLLAGVAYLAMWDRRSLPRFMRHAGLYSATIAIPLAALLFWNHFRAGSATSRVLTFHLPGADKLQEGLLTAVNFFLPYQVAERMPLLSFCALLVLLAISVVMLRHHGNDRERRFVLISLLGALAYGAFLCVSLTFFDDLTPLDERILVPFALFLVPLPVYAACLMVAKMRAGLWKIAGAGVLAYMIMFTAYRSLMFMEYAYNDGLGYARRAVRESVSLRDAVRLSRDIKVYSNAPEAASLLYGCADFTIIPHKLEPMSLKPLPGYNDQMRHLRDEVQAHRAIVALFFFKHRPEVWTHYLPTPEEMRDTLGAVDIHSYNDAVFLGSPESRERVRKLLGAGAQQP